MRVGMIFRQELMGSFDGRVRGLHRDLRCGQIPPNENVQVRNLGEWSRHWSSGSGGLRVETRPLERIVRSRAAQVHKKM